MQLTRISSEFFFDKGGVHHWDEGEESRTSNAEDISADSQGVYVADSTHEER